MSKTLQTEPLARDNHRILAYMNHLAKTEQQADDKRLFEAFALQAKRRIAASGGLQMATGEIIGREQTQRTPETGAIQAPVTYS